MSEEIQTADANLHALHAERAALRQAAQTAGITLWANGDTYHAALNDAEATGATPGAALVALCARLQQSAEAWEDIARDEAKKHGEALAIVKRLRDEESAELESTRADLDTLRNGVAWLGSELDRVKAWARVWKRAAKRGARDWRDLVAAYEDMRAENAAVRRAARQLVVAWRGEKGRAEAWRMLAEEGRERADRLSGAETNENSPDHPTV